MTLHLLFRDFRELQGSGRVGKICIFRQSCTQASSCLTDFKFPIRPEVLNSFVKRARSDINDNLSGCAMSVIKCNVRYWRYFTTECDSYPSSVELRAKPFFLTAKPFFLMVANCRLGNPWRSGGKTMWAACIWGRKGPQQGVKYPNIGPSSPHLDWFPPSCLQAG